MNFRYPVFLDVAGKRCLVTGEGYEIPPKVHTLVRRGAQVIYVNPTAEESIATLAAEGRLTWHQRQFEPHDLEGCLLVITDQEDNSEVFRLAEAQNVLCNAADDPEFCRFSFGSVVARGDLTMAISTNGIAPALAVRLRERLEKEIGQEYERFVEMLGKLRQEITHSIPDFGARKALWYRLVDSEALTLLRAGHEEEAVQLLRRMVDEAQQAAPEIIK
jgi:precorrin-2 dehydrogenase / sirohydrochlorin ferrochelatase